MIKSYLRVALRNLRNPKAFSFINIIGLLTVSSHAIKLATANSVKSLRYD